MKGLIGKVMIVMGVLAGGLLLFYVMHTYLDMTCLGLVIPGILMVAVLLLLNRSERGGNGKDWEEEAYSAPGSGAEEIDDGGGI